MTIRIWHQSFTVLSDLPAYEAALAAHFRTLARSDTEIVMHGMRAGTYETEYPGTDIRHHVIQHLHSSQFIAGALAAERTGFDAYAIMSIPDVGLTEARALVDIPVVGYGESAMLTACALGAKFGILTFIDDLPELIADNVARYGLQARCAASRPAGFSFHDVLAGFARPAPLIERFMVAARALIGEGADVIIPGEAPLNVLLASNNVNRVDDCPVIDAIGATIKMAETLVDLRRATGVMPSRKGYFRRRPPARRIEELMRFYQLDQL
ncbi:MAG: racemase [Burkholderiales bacterium]|nr:racemase [Burkholderiales bacterium]